MPHHGHIFRLWVHEFDNEYGVKAIENVHAMQFPYCKWYMCETANNIKANRKFDEIYSSSAAASLF